MANEGFKKYFLNTGWLLSDKTIQLFVGFLISIYIARYLGPENFGILSFAISFVALFAAFSGLGLEGIIVREAVLNPESHSELLGTAFGLKIMGGLALILLVAVSMQLTGISRQTQLIVIIIATGQFILSFQVIEYYFQSQVQAKTISIVSIISIVISAAIKIFLLWTKSSLIWFAIVICIENAIKMACLIISYKIYYDSILRWRFRCSISLNLLKESWPLALSGFVAMIYMRIDQIMIKFMLGNSAVGKYSIAVNISEAWYFVPFAITTSLFPAITKTKNTKLYHEKIFQLYSLMTLTGYIFAILLSFSAGTLINVFFGQDYSDSIIPLIILSWGGIFVGLSRAFGIWLINENYSHKNLYRTLLGAITNIVLNYLLIPRFHLIGAAYATLIALISTNLLYDLFDRATHTQLKLKINSFLPFITPKSLRKT